MNTPLKAAVLISGTGSNLQALIDAIGSGRLHAEIVHVISNVADAPGLKRAEGAGIPTTVLEHERFTDRSEFDRALALLVGAENPDLILLAGFMRIIGSPVLDAFPGKIINLHPALLPLYRGMDTYRRAIEAGDSQHGASIHFVTADLDGGPVISQVVIPILGEDDPNSLAARLSPMEHRLVVATVEFFAAHKVESRDEAVYVDGEKLERPMLLRANALVYA